MLICPECLRAFHMNIVEERTGVIEILCRFCPCTNKYIIQPAGQDISVGKRNAGPAPQINLLGFADERKKLGFISQVPAFPND